MVCASLILSYATNVRHNCTSHVVRIAFATCVKCKQSTSPHVEDSVISRRCSLQVSTSLSWGEDPVSCWFCSALSYLLILRVSEKHWLMACDSRVLWWLWQIQTVVYFCHPVHGIQINQRQSEIYEDICNVSFRVTIQRELWCATFICTQLNQIQGNTG